MNWIHLCEYSFLSELRESQCLFLHVHLFFYIFESSKGVGRKWVGNDGSPK